MMTVAKPLKLSKERLIEKGWRVWHTRWNRSKYYTGPMWAVENPHVPGMAYAWTEDEGWTVAQDRHIAYKVLPITKKSLMDVGWQVKRRRFWSMQYQVIAPDGQVIAEEQNLDEAWRTALFEMEKMEMGDDL